jgi:hypothetical protein
MPYTFVQRETRNGVPCVVLTEATYAALASGLEIVRAVAEWRDSWVDDPRVLREMARSVLTRVER